ncbi:MAG: YkvA family protein [Acidimicrobiia bacterium]
MTYNNQERVRPDEVVPPGGNAVQGRKLIQDTILIVPNIVKLVGRLLSDPRVPRRSKIALGAAAAYVASPIDLIPDIVPVVGWADDILFMLLAIDGLITRSGPEIVEEHWDGPVDLLKLIEDVLSLARGLVPGKIRGIFDRLNG